MVRFKHSTRSDHSSDRSSKMGLRSEITLNNKPRYWTLAVQIGPPFTVNEPLTILAENYLQEFLITILDDEIGPIPRNT
jgi:hypothetical protein